MEVYVQFHSIPRFFESCSASSRPIKLLNPRLVPLLCSVLCHFFEARGAWGAQTLYEKHFIFKIKVYSFKSKTRQSKAIHY